MELTGMTVQRPIFVTAVSWWLHSFCVYLGKRGEWMYQIYALLGLMCFTWGAAIYASYAGESLPRPFPPTV